MVIVNLEIHLVQLVWWPPGMTTVNPSNSSPLDHVSVNEVMGCSPINQDYHLVPLYDTSDHEGMI
jgi:hypothetical protein